MRDLFDQLVNNYPKAPISHDGTMVGSSLHLLATRNLPEAVRRVLPPFATSHLVSGSVGKGDWTHTPWIAVLDPTTTTTLEEGVYAIYLLSYGCDRLYLTVNQGCTILKKTVGMSGARETLVQRAATIWSRIEHKATRLRPIKMNLNVAPTIWRGKLYEYGAIAGKAYAAHDLPSSDEMTSDLHEALELCKAAKQTGEWVDEEEILRQALDDGLPASFNEGKRYRQHRAIERQAAHAKLVKKLQGTRCKCCGLEMSAVYGELARDMVDAHHLLALSKFDDDQVISLDPLRDFAVLCPNCHRAIHRLPDCSNLDALRELVMCGVLSDRSKADT